MTSLPVWFVLGAVALPIAYILVQARFIDRLSQEVREREELFADAQEAWEAERHSLVNELDYQQELVNAAVGKVIARLTGGDE